MTDKEYMLSVFSDAGLSLTEKQCDDLTVYYEMLVKKNEVMNLTGITEYHEVVVKHFLDSCILLKYREKLGSTADVGTGAGFPGLPLKILCPEDSFVLLDSLNKRLAFLNEVITALELTKVETVHARAEDGVKTYRASFDTVVSRAVANLSTLSEYCLPYVKIGGYFIAFKSGDVDAEVSSAENALKILGGKLDHIEKFSLPFEAGERSLVFIKKVKETPRKYPRKAGTPQKDPL